MIRFHCYVWCGMLKAPPTESEDGKMRDVTEALDIIDELDEDLRQHALEYLRSVKQDKGAA